MLWLAVWLATWALWVPPLLAFAGALAPSLLAQGRTGLRAARSLAIAALGGILVLVLVAVFTQPDPRFAVIDLLLAGGLVSLAALGVRAIFAWALVVFAALAAAKGIGLAAMGFSVTTFLAPALTGGLAWLAAALLALALAVMRLRRAPRRSTRA